MSIDVPAAAVTADWPALNVYECRVLGVLVEKAKTTPDAYPLSINALVTGCNQKSNRDPVLNLEEIEAEEALADLQKKGLVIRLTGSGRVERWRHNLYDAWQVGKVELAVLAELLLRGAQTEGELRGRASRMEEIPDLDALRDILQKMVERRLVVYLSPPGSRGARVTHGYQAAQELEQLKRREAHEPPARESAAPAARPTTPAAAPLSADRSARLEESLTQANREIAQLKSEVGELRAMVNSLQEELRKLREALGA